MRYVALPNGIPAASVLGMGCAAMMGSAGRRDSLRALHAAHEAGINFFDTARSYGYGASEGLLGEFLRGRRDRAVVCTKFGILPAAHSWKQRVKPLARAAIRLFPGLRKAARAQAGPLPTANQFSVPVLRTSLETSLRELKTEYVDILLMHAAPVGVLAQQDLLEELGRLVTEGKVRLAGISGEMDVIAATLAQRPAALGTAQFACNVANFPFLNSLASDPPTGLFLVANHPFGGPLGVAETRRRIAALRADSSIARELRAKLDGDDPQLLPDLVLNAILSGTGIDAVIPAMLQPRHLQSNCQAVEASRFTAEELRQIRRALGGGGGS